MKYTRFIDSTLFADLDELDVWLTGRGITQRNRIRIYRANLIAMMESEKAVGPADVFKQIEKAGRINEILASYVEGYECASALTDLRVAQVYIPDELLRHALDGPPDPSRETLKSNRGRNAMFELTVGAMLARENLHPTFSTGNPDVAFRFEGRRILVECKRILSESRALPVISEGIRQLCKQVNPTGGDVGLVAVNISRMFNRGDGWWDVPADSNVHEILSEMVRQYIESIGDGLLRKKDAVATAVLFYAAAPFRVKGLGYVPVRTGTFCPFDVERNAFLARLASSLHW